MRALWLSSVFSVDLFDMKLFNWEPEREKDQNTENLWWIKAENDWFHIFQSETDLWWHSRQTVITIELKQHLIGLVN